MATQSLFDIIYSSVSTPVKVEQERLQNEELKLKIQGEGLALQNQQAFQKAMTDLWGPGGEATAAGASQKGDMADDARLRATASLLYRFGEPQKGTQVLNTLSLINERKTIEQQKQMWTERQRVGAIAGVASSITDQASYSAALPSLIENMTPQQQEQAGLTGDYEADKTKLGVLAQSATTFAAKEKLAGDAAKHADLQAYRNRAMDYKGEAVAQGWARVAQGEARLDNWGKHEAYRQEMGWRKDARAQEGANTKASRAGNTGTKNPPKLEATERSYAQSTFAEDPRTKEIPANQRDVLWQEAALAAKRNHPEIPFPEALDATMKEMEGKGAFKPSGTSLFGRKTYEYKGPTTGATVRQGAAPSPTDPAAYGTVDSVTAAYKKGAITYDQAAKILREKFGVK